MAKEWYKLVAGVHYHNDPTGNPVKSPSWDGSKFTPENLFRQGDMLESEIDLSMEFPNKWVKVDQTEKKGPITEARREAVSALISSGQWPEEDRDFLCELTDSNFERILRRSKPVESPETPAPEGGKRRASRLGEDITDEFGRAYDEGLKVWRNPAGKFQVTKQGVSLKPLNLEPLESPEAVTKFVEEYLAAAK